MRNNKNDKNSSVNPVAAGVAGAIVGAGVAVAANAAMKDDKTRAQVKKVISNVKDQATKYVDQAKKSALVTDGKKQVKKAVERIEKETKS